MSPETIIAVASGVQALATVVLVGVTIRYVILTRGILRTSQAHLQDARDLLDASLRMSRSHLLALVAKIEPGSKELAIRTGGHTVQSFPGRAIYIINANWAVP